VLLREGLRLEPDSVSLRATLGVVRAKRGELDEGLGLAVEAVRDSNPTDTYVRGELRRAADEHSGRRAVALWAGFAMPVLGSVFLYLTWQDHGAQPASRLVRAALGIFLVALGLFLLKVSPRRLPAAVRAFRGERR
jgi:hypothetical protein